MISFREILTFVFIVIGVIVGVNFLVDFLFSLGWLGVVSAILLLVWLIVSTFRDLDR